MKPTKNAALFTVTFLMGTIGLWVLGSFFNLALARERHVLSPNEKKAILNYSSLSPQDPSFTIAADANALAQQKVGPEHVLAALQELKVQPQTRYSVLRAGMKLARAFPERPIWAELSAELAWEKTSAPFHYTHSLKPISTDEKAVRFSGI